MNGFDSQLARDFKNTWNVIEFVDGMSNETNMDVIELLDFYLRVSKEGKLEECNVWADLHFISGGSKSAFDWLYEKIKHIEPNREALLEGYKAFDTMNWECVGNMFLHYDLPPPCRTKVMEQSPLISENSGYETIQIYR